MPEIVASIPITFDKSHLITIGEKLYTESIELIRELVNNAYDADATDVHVNISEDKIVIEDNGSGMDENGLRQYFSIGSTEKKKHNKSPIFNRIRIGEFGIGKFASLAACGHFEVTTRKDDFAATVIFDKDEWNQNVNEWDLPLRHESPNILKSNGTRVTLSKLSKRFDAADVERRILEGVPIKADNFGVHLNGKKLSARFVAGQRIPIFEGTEYGPISGELIIVSNATLMVGGAGIEIKVKGATVKKDLFGMETNFPQLNLLSGEIYADFLPITSDRTNFILDSPEYQSFKKSMKQALERVLHDIKYWQKQKEKQKIKRAVNDAIEKVLNALKKNPDLASLIGLPINENKDQPEAKRIDEPKKPKTLKKTSGQKHMVAKVLGPSAVITRLKMGQKGISCQLDHFSADAPESYTEGSVIYINLDHPLYAREAKNRERLIMHLARLLTQEITLLKNPKNARQAFDAQSKLMTDALIENHLENTAKMG
ncbi:ATP-binding protein [Candidatus Saganbacteria bacterium]|nr:ATP-binding protein [Candidatus Saganbacteria bacterium]